MALRIKQVLESKGLTNTSLAELMGISKQAVGQMIKAESLTTATLEKIAEALEVPLWHLVTDPDKVLDCQDNNKDYDFSAFVRCGGVHYTADNIDEFNKIVEEVRKNHLQKRP